MQIERHSQMIICCNSIDLQVPMKLILRYFTYMNNNRYDQTVGLALWSRHQGICLPGSKASYRPWEDLDPQQPIVKLQKNSTNSDFYPPSLCS